MPATSISIGASIRPSNFRSPRGWLSSPATNDLYIVTHDRSRGQGDTSFHAKAFAKALARYSHQYRGRRLSG